MAKLQVLQPKNMSTLGLVFVPATQQYKVNMTYDINTNDPNAVAGSALTNTLHTRLQKLESHFDTTALASDKRNLLMTFGKKPPSAGALTGSDSRDDIFGSEEGFIISQTRSESAGLKADGDSITMWSPGDSPNGILTIYDEDVAGTSYWRLDGSFNVVRVSDEGLKTNIKNIDTVDLDKFEKVRIANYQLKSINEAIKEVEASIATSDNERVRVRRNKKLKRLRKKLRRLKRKQNVIGTIAQDIQKVFPFAAQQDDVNNIATVNDTYIFWGLFKVVQQLVAEVKQLQKATPTSSSTTVLKRNCKLGRGVTHGGDGGADSCSFAEYSERSALVRVHLNVEVSNTRTKRIIARLPKGIPPPTSVVEHFIDEGTVVIAPNSREVRIGRSLLSGQSIILNLLYHAS